jgi:hypothetical protein
VLQVQLQAGDRQAEEMDAPEIPLPLPVADPHPLPLVLLNTLPRQVLDLHRAVMDSESRNLVLPLLLSAN